MTYETAVRKLYNWQHNRTECFHDHLFDLFQKADTRNRCLLTAVFPTESLVLRDWEMAGDGGEDLFKEHGLAHV